MPDKDYAASYFGADLAKVDPDIQRIIELEEERQKRRIILIPSESMAPAPVRAALGSVFNNIYAEGYPPTRMSQDSEETLLQADWELVNYRRYADRRFYKGADYVNFVETLAQRRCAQLDKFHTGFQAGTQLTQKAVHAGTRLRRNQILER